MTESTFSESDGAEVWIYVRGRLVMKRWRSTGVSATFHVAPSGVGWSWPEKKPLRPIRRETTDE